ncbi:unnamed protein product [Pedinophyceae sp. YPF-701]|nr:unnamed protein product [Pedinophyceae sp. YPF-701]
MARASIEASEDDDSLRVIDRALIEETQESYLAYAMSTLVGRALPDVRDGLKPVHRRILWAMHDLGLVPNKPHRKSARVVGEVLGKYHPHGDSAVYDALVRLAQDFNMSIPLIQGHGNFGSIDDDPAAAMRYTECRLAAATPDMLLDGLSEDVVDFLPTFDGSQLEPTAMPAKVPHVLVNGSYGVAVGLSTSIPTHNMREVVAALKAFIADPEISVEGLMAHMPAPDFPTGGELVDTRGLRQAYAVGRGSATVRGRIGFEAGKRGQRDALVITEIPFQTNKARMVKEIAALVEKRKVEGVSDIRDESDRSGIRVVVELKRSANADLVRNVILKGTSLQRNVNLNLTCVVDGTPRQIGLQGILGAFLEFRRDVVRRRTAHALKKAEHRLLLVEGFLAAAHRVQDVVRAITAADDSAGALAALETLLGVTREQADAVLGMPLRRLTRLEGTRLADEAAELKTKIRGLQNILSDADKVDHIIVEEAEEVARKYGCDRRTAVLHGEDGTIENEDVIPNKESIVVVTEKGYIKRMSSNTIKSQARRTRGKAGARLRGEDLVYHVQQIMDHDTLLFFTEAGQAFSLRGFQIPETSRTTIGTPLVDLIPRKGTEGIAGVIAVRDFPEDVFLVMLTREGQIKRTSLSAFSSVSRAGMGAMRLREGDQVIQVAACREGDSIMMTTSEGYALNMPVNDAQLRSMGRLAQGNRAMKLRAGASMVAMAILPQGESLYLSEDEDDEDVDIDDEGDDGDGDGAQHAGPWVVLVTSDAYGKRVPVELFRLQRRGGRGVRCLPSQGKKRTLKAMLVADDAKKTVLLTSSKGVMNRIALGSVRVTGRTAVGVHLMRLGEGDSIASVAAGGEDDDSESEEEP